MPSVEVGTSAQAGSGPSVDEAANTEPTSAARPRRPYARRDGRLSTAAERLAFLEAFKEDT